MIQERSFGRTYQGPTEYGYSTRCPESLDMQYLVPIAISNRMGRTRARAAQPNSIEFWWVGKRKSLENGGPPPIEKRPFSIEKRAFSIEKRPFSIEKGAL